MPELDLSATQTIRIAGYDALAIRAADIDIWTVPGYRDFSIFGNDSPILTYVPEYITSNDLGAGGWVANNFYTYGSEYPGATIAGVRIWIPDESPAIGRAAKINVWQPSTVIDSNPSTYMPEQVMNNIINGEALTEFPSGTLVAGWNDLYFNTQQPLRHYTYICAGISIEGGYYVYGPDPVNAPYPSHDTIRLAISEHHTSLGSSRGEFIYTDGYTDWSSAHYGLDLIVRRQLSEYTGLYSVFDNNEPEDATYVSESGLGAGGWTGANFYSYKESGAPEPGWKLVGARIWIPPEERDVAGVIGQTAQAGYYIKQSGAIVASADDPADIISSFITSSTLPITLVSGWNEVHFVAPIELDWAAGVAVGWSIGNGDRYVYAGLNENPVPSMNNIPFRLASNIISDERRGVFRDSSGTHWSYQNLHYGIDVIVQDPLT